MCLSSADAVCSAGSAADVSVADVGVVVSAGAAVVLVAEHVVSDSIEDINDRARAPVSVCTRDVS